ncbi:hypothetical protein L1887_10348 [Cichorium endivia]|nr:hypothetical protein L1887_10348 [Cichorium endivia]
MSSSDPPHTAAAVVVAATLADHLGSERQKDGVRKRRDSIFLSKQKSCKEFRHSENNSNTKNSFKEHQIPIYSVLYGEIPCGTRTEKPLYFFSAPLGTPVFVANTYINDDMDPLMMLSKHCCSCGCK